MKKKGLKNILFIEYCPDLKGGGAQRVFLNILNAIDTDHLTLFAGFPTVTSGELKNEVPAHVQVYKYDSKSPGIDANRFISYLKFILFTPVTFIKWFYLIWKNEVDVVYVHSIISGMHFSMLKPFLGFKLVYHEHNMASQRPSSALWKALFSYVVRSADLIIAISTDVKLSLVEHGVDEDKVKIIYNGINLIDLDCYEHLVINGKDRLGIKSSSDVIVGMVGHFRPWKGQLLFVEALKGIIEKIPDIKFVIVGGIHDQQYYNCVIKYITDNKLSDKVIVTGHQSNVDELIACMDVVVVPSVPEPFGLVVLESMMMNKPVVAFNMGGPAEIIQHGKTGLLVDEVSSDKLAHAIELMVLDPNGRKTMGKSGRNLLENRFTSKIQSEIIETEVFKLYESNSQS